MYIADFHMLRNSPDNETTPAVSFTSVILSTSPMYKYVLFTITCYFLLLLSSSPFSYRDFHSKHFLFNRGNNYLFLLSSAPWKRAVRMRSCRRTGPAWSDWYALFAAWQDSCDNKSPLRWSVFPEVINTSGGNLFLFYKKSSQCQHLATHLGKL